MSVRVGVARFLRSTLFMQLGGIVPAILGVVVIPLLVRDVGEAGFGAWVAILAAINALSTLDLGLSSTVTKAVAERATRGDAPVRAAVRTAFTVTLLMGLVIAGATMASVGPILRGLGVAPRDQGMVALSAGVVAFTWLIVSYCSWVLMGLGRFGTSSLFFAVLSVLRTGLGLGLVLLGLGLPGLAIAYAAAGLVTTTGALWATRRALGPGLPLGLELSREAVREHGAFSLSSFVQILGATVALETVPVYLAGRWFGPAGLVTFYLGQRVSAIAGRALASAGTVIYSTAAETGPDREAQRELLRRGTRWMVLLAAPLVVVIYLYAPALLRVWMGNADAGAIAMVQILVTSTFVIALGETAYYILWVRHVHRVTVITVAAALAGVAVSAATLGTLGVASVAVGVLAYAMVTTVASFVGAFAVTGGTPWEVVRGLAGAVVPSAGAAATAIALLRAWPPTSLVTLGTAMLATAAVYIVLLGLFALPEERQAVRSLLPWARRGARSGMADHGNGGMP